MARAGIRVPHVWIKDPELAVNMYVSGVCFVGNGNVTGWGWEWDLLPGRFSDHNVPRIGVRFLFRLIPVVGLR
jgi:hypothetical protein